MLGTLISSELPIKWLSAGSGESARLSSQQHTSAYLGRLDESLTAAFTHYGFRSRQGCSPPGTSPNKCLSLSPHLAVLSWFLYI